MSAKCVRSADSHLNMNVRLQYIPAVQAEILYVREGAEVAVKGLLILATAKRPR